MGLTQGLFLFGIILTITILNVEGDLKFDAQGNIIDDGLNLENDLPKDLRKTKPLVKPKRNRLLPESNRVMANSAGKGSENAKAPAAKEPTLDELLKMAGLDSRGQKIEAPIAPKSQKIETTTVDKVAQKEDNSNLISNLSPEQMKALLAQVEGNAKRPQEASEAGGGSRKSAQKPERRADTGAEDMSEAKADTAAEDKSEAKADTAAEEKSVTKADIAAEEKSGAKAVTAAEEKSGTKADTAAEEKSGAKVDTAAEEKSETLAQGSGDMLEDGESTKVTEAEAAGATKKEAETAMETMMPTEASADDGSDKAEASANDEADKVVDPESTEETPEDGEQAMELYPWQSEVCADYDEAACAAFKPMCSIMGVIAHKKCRKTCKLCLQDETSPRTLKAKLKEFSLTLTQNGPLAPSFLTVCVDKSAAQQYGLPEDAMSLVIHAYGDATEDTCENFGPHFNPYGVPHGHPEDVSKHVGDLGILEFRQVPDEWPEDVIKCKATQIGSYGVFDHINLYGENSPCYRPVVLYKGEAPMKEFKPSLAIACDVLDENDGLKNGYKAGEIPLAPENTTAVTAVAPLLAANATRVHAAREAQDLLEAVKVKAAAAATLKPSVNGSDEEEDVDATEKSDGVTKGENSQDLEETAANGASMAANATMKPMEGETKAEASEDETEEEATENDTEKPVEEGEED